MPNNIMEDIVDKISKYNGLTKKTTQKLLNDLIKNKNNLDDLISELNALKTSVDICETCKYYKINKKCIICDDATRNQNLICVVSSQLDVTNIEKNNKYKGLYHVIDGEINLMKNKTPNDIEIESLIKRIDPSKELILALNATFEGELTANYIFQKVKTLKINISRIAKGIPMGGSLDYMDESTLESAFKNRKKYEG